MYFQQPKFSFCCYFLTLVKWSCIQFTAFALPKMKHIDSFFFPSECHRCDLVLQVCGKEAWRISGNFVKDAFSVCFPTSEALWWEHCYHLLLNKSGTGWDNPVSYSDSMLSFTRRAYACRAYGLWQPCMSFACRVYGFFLLLKDLWNKAVE